MKRGCLALSFILFVHFVAYTQGTTCATPIPIPLDSVLRSYTISSSTGDNIICTSSGTTPITYFSVTTNSSAQDFVLNITGPGGAVEVAFYGGTTCNNGALEVTSSVCFYDGTGLCAPGETFVLGPNTTYTLRIKTQTTGSIQIRGYFYTPPNKTCLTATEIGTILTFDQNANHKPGSGVSPAELCSSSLENTAFYYYTVETTGTSGVLFENVACDNQPDLNNNGYQFGLFSGTCGSLTNLACHTGPPGDMQLNTPSLAAGTRVYVVVDGVAGSNCFWGIRGINAIILAAQIKDFSGWKMNKTNLLKWTTLDESENSYYEIQRSDDRRNYKTIGKLSSIESDTEEKYYEFEDKNPPAQAWYRLQYNESGDRRSYSKIISLKRTGMVAGKIEIINPVNDQLNMRVYSNSKTDYTVTVLNSMGQVILKDRLVCDAGLNFYQKTISSLSAGVYRVVISDQHSFETASFVRLRN
jgi:hypothetical protein